ncbi:hypothetical protein ILUMI_12516 [Ignelater luminosus]|uniref:Ribosome biogenesis protein WDR12 homolog n=1 Tax=Ignelater luminosus TaxID=2038154 RepID=A0A8K0CY05_IGNLU|nr:hypothetical protein ILUMI_12516 [Ignelater luminosus]
MERMDQSAEAQLQVRFVTKQETYAVPDVPFSVPQNIDTSRLNKLLNELLRENAELLKPTEFDFLVLGQLLRVPLIEHLQEFNESIEATVEIEYVQRTPAPEPEDALLHDDWISGIQVADKWVLTGCYDQTINIWTTRGKHQVSAREHTNIVKAVCWLKQGDPSGGFVTVSHDLTGIIWKWEPSEEQPKPVTVLRGHERGIDAVGVSSNSERLATGGWDTYLKLWSASLDVEDCYEPFHKKIRGVQGKATIARTPLHTLKGHKESIVAIQWSESDTICTASMDHTLKLWDAELCGLRNEVVAEKAFLGASWSPLSRTIITCSADRHIRLYDPRSTEGSVCKTLFTSHTLWVSAVTWSQHNEHLFMSGSYDECVKLWDTRCPRAPLYDLSGHEGKVLCVDWSNPKHLVSGGTDNSVHIFKNRQFN